jgi:hypothetical protein
LRVSHTTSSRVQTYSVCLTRANNSYNYHDYPELVDEGKLRELIRTIQDMRKSQNAKLDQQIILTIIKGQLPDNLLQTLKEQTLAQEIRFGSTLEVTLI